MIKAVLHFQTTEKIVFIKPGSTLREILHDGGFFIDYPCGGHGICGKCAIKVSGALSPVTSSEKSKLTQKLLENGYRLSCLAKAVGDVEIILPHSIDTIIETNFVDTLSLTQPLNSKITDKSVEAKESNIMIGLAVDIGTTTLAARFFNLDTGAEMGTETALNPQSIFGADVISRIEACMQFGTEKLQLAINGAINSMIISFCTKHGLSADLINNCIFAGNTVMLHIVAGLSPEGMAVFPFEPKTLFGYSLPASKLGIKINSDASVYFAPCLSAFVGGDITAGLLACSIDSLCQPTLFVDVGTNGEIALLCGDNIFCCSTAAGPAFEGAHIECGTGCIIGAINQVFEQNGKLVFETIGEKKPCGICGSGLIDASSVLLSRGIFDETGAFDTENSSETKGKYYFGKTEIFISQQDIREIQLAKSAIISGIETLLNIANIGSRSVAFVFIAGGFGAHMNIKSACKIGLLPSVFSEIAKPVGNTSLEGASKLLLNSDSFNRIKEITRRCKNIDLAENVYFQQQFIENMLLEPR